MTSKEKITTTLNWVQTSYIDWNFMRGLKQDLEEFVEIAQAELVDKIANFFEKEENWRALKNCWLENGRSDDLRRLLHKALKE